MYFVVRTRKHIYVAHDARSQTHDPRTCIPACQQTRVHALHNVIIHTIHKCAHFYVLMRAGYVLHSLECLERGVVGKCCSNVLRSLRAYGVGPKAVCTCKTNDTAHVHTSRYIYTYAYVHADIPNTNTHAYLARIPTFIPVHNAI
jgi:hypothetical protein